MRIRVLQQRMEAGRVYARAGFWRDDQDPASEPALFEQDFDLPAATVRVQRIVDPAGRWTTRSGQVLLPVVERDGEWQPRREDPADPFQTIEISLDPVAEAQREMLAWAEQELVRRGV